MEKTETLEPFQATLRHLVWALIEDWVKAEIESEVRVQLHTNSSEQLTYESEDFSEKVNELIGDYINYNVSVSVDCG